MEQRSRGIFFNIDYIALLLYLLLVGIGLISIYAANFDPAHASIFDVQKNYGKQIIWIATAFFIACLILLLDSRFFPTFAYGFYGVTMVMLFAVLFVGKLVNGNRGWFEIGSFRLQPAEFAKLATCLAVAKYLGGTNVRWSILKNRVVTIIILFIPFGLIMLQDPGSALTFTAFVFVLYREGLPTWVLVFALVTIVLFVLALLIKPLYMIGAIVVLGFGIYYLFLPRRRQTLLLTAGVVLIASGFVFVVPVVLNKVLKPHQRVRVNNLVGKDIDKKGNYYNVNQSQIAIGSGRLWGKGFLQGTQTKYDFVPEQTTDFIFCTVGEEWGFAGTLAVIALYVGLLLRIFIISERQRGVFGRVFGYGVASILFFHIVINIGMTIGLVPVIGIPLPFISYGGSSLWSFTILLFILLKQDSSRSMLR